MADRKYNIIYAAPPGKCKVWSDKGTGCSIESHCPAMGNADLYKLPMESSAANDCAMFIWITFPFLFPDSTMKGVRTDGICCRTERPK